MLDQFAVDALAANRLTVLVTRDRIAGPIRWRLIRRSYRQKYGDDFVVPLDHTADQIVKEDPDPPKLAYFMHCMWCFGLWVCFGVVIFRRLFPGVWRLVRVPLAMSSAVALLDEASG